MAGFRGNRTAAAWWCLIIISIALKITSPWQAWVSEEGPKGGDDQILLAIIQMQGRFLIGAPQAQTLNLERNLTEMESLATTDRTSIAVAAIRFFLDPEGNGKWRALAMINARLKEIENTEEADNLLLLENVRKVLNQPDQLSDEGREQIRSEMAWFGELLLSANATRGSPQAEKASSIRKQCFKVVAFTGALSLLVMLIGLAGVVLLSVALLRLKAGKLQFTGICDDVPAQPYLGAFAIYLSLMVLVEFLATVLSVSFKITIYPVLANLMILASVGIGFYWPRFRGLAWRDTLRGFGWCRGKGVLREVRAGLIGYIAVTPIIALGLATSMLLILLSGWLTSKGIFHPEQDSSPVPVTHPVLKWISNGDWKVKLGVIFSASVLAPLFEETLFRGALYGVIRKRWNFVISGLLSGFIFAAVHPQGILAIPGLTAAGFGFALIREWRGTVIPSMTAHAIHNGIVVTSLIIALS